MLDLNHLRAEFADYLAENTKTRWGMDAALMHVCRMAYEAGVNDGKRMPEPAQESPVVTPVNQRAYFPRVMDRWRS